MIYLVTTKQELFPNEIYSIITAEKSLELLKNFNKKIVQFDTETLGLDPHLDDALTFQFGNIEGTTQIVVDVTTINPIIYKEIFDDYFFIGQNLLFDCKVCYKFGLIIRNLWDCMIVEQLLYLGFPKFAIGASPEIIMEYADIIENCDNWEDMNSKQKTSYISKVSPKVHNFIQNESGVSLKALCKRYLNETISKEVRGQIIYKGLATEVIEYAANELQEALDNLDELNY